MVLNLHYFNVFVNLEFCLNLFFGFNTAGGTKLVCTCKRHVQPQLCHLLVCSPAEVGMSSLIASCLKCLTFTSKFCVHKKCFPSFDWSIIWLAPPCMHQQ
ncbi:hypothetical protein XENOCAPTIV_013223 [Xenoophorus captivus]|uniref:Secreted protein n=1 Tax=Xenoophorus captivus TaxID=1517983 RepID=A0ABV0QRM3_9TELE